MQSICVTIQGPSNQPAKQYSACYDPPKAESLKTVTELFEAVYIQQVLEFLGGDIPATMKALNISQATLYRKIALVRKKRLQFPLTLVTQKDT